MNRALNKMRVDGFDEYNKKLETLIGTTENHPRITLEDIPGTLSYRRDTHKFGTHEGQRKLLLSEILFLTDVDEKYVVYAGSAPGNKNKFLQELFPEKKIIMIDPNAFLIKYEDKTHYHIESDVLYFHFNDFHYSLGRKTYKNINFYNYETKEITNNKNDIIKMKDYMDHIDDIVDMIKTTDDYNLFIINDLFTTELAEALNALGDFVFISDIRTNIGAVVNDEDDTGHPTDFDILFNSAQMFNWINAMPEVGKSMLKFRTPYLKDSVLEDNVPDIMIAKESGYDVIGDYKKDKYRFFKGDAYLQAFAGKSSTETRLIFEGVPELVEYNAAEYEERFMYFNCYDRSVILFDNPDADVNLRFDLCHDCALERYIWLQYLEAREDDRTVQDMVRSLNQILKRDSDHGYMFEVNSLWINSMLHSKR